MNGANEMAVALFLKDRIKFLQIGELVEKALNNINISYAENDILSVLEADRVAREYVNNLVGE